jgi:hypothetical protein
LPSETVVDRHRECDEQEAGGMEAKDAKKVEKYRRKVEKITEFGSPRRSWAHRGNEQKSNVTDPESANTAPPPLRHGSWPGAQQSEPGRR